MPSKFNETTKAKIIEALEYGATYELASNYAGITYQSFRNWIKRGEAEMARLETPRTKPREDESPYVEFVERVRQSEGKAAVKWLLKIEQAAKRNWQAAAWKLERRYPGAYGRKSVDLTSAGKELKGLTASELSDDELARIASGK
jgi:hypothetical protein